MDGDDEIADVKRMGRKATESVNTEGEIHHQREKKRRETDRERAENRDAIARKKELVAKEYGGKQNGGFLAEERGEKEKNAQYKRRER